MLFKMRGLEHTEINGKELEQPHETESQPGERSSRMGYDTDFRWEARRVSMAPAGWVWTHPGSRKLGELTWGGPSPQSSALSLRPAQREGCGMIVYLVPDTELLKSWQFPDWKLFCHSQSPPFHHPNIYANEVTCGMPLDSFWMGLVARKTTPL